MKMIKNKFFITFLTLSFASNTFTMEPIEPQKKNELFPFTKLPLEMQYKIILSIINTAASLKDAGQKINALAQTNIELNQLINDPKICLKIIKNLAQRFNCSDQEAALALQTKEAINHLVILDKFVKLCHERNSNAKDFNILYEQYKGYVDLNFIFLWLEDDTTLLIEAVLRNNCSLITALINHGANINQSNLYGTTPLAIAAWNGNINTIKCLLNYPNIVLNQQDKNGRTALLTVSIKEKSIIKLLLDAGVDPELADNEHITLLQKAKSYGNQEIIDLIQNAIDKKHGKK
jgi:uncharacterized protein